MAENTQLRLDVTLDLGSDQINGTIIDGDGPQLEFTGWLELMSAFDTVINRASTSKQHTAPPGATTGPSRHAVEPGDWGAG